MGKRCFNQSCVAFSTKATIKKDNKCKLCGFNYKKHIKQLDADQIGMELQSFFEANGPNGKRSRALFSVTKSFRPSVKVKATLLVEGDERVADIAWLSPVIPQSRIVQIGDFKIKIDLEETWPTETSKKL